MLTLYDEFAGAGGSSQGAAAVPGVELIFAANHNKLALSTHRANFPDVDHWDGDVQREDITRFPRADLFWASPACPPWTDARGKKRDFDKSNQQVIPGMGGKTEPDQATMRARALMEEIPRYLRYWSGRGRPVLAGVVENVIQCRKWDDWPRWRREFHELGYVTRLIAINSMHVRAPRSRRAPQSRDRLFLAYIHKSICRLPDWDKWLRPLAYCPGCDQRVRAIQVFKNPRNDMGRYRSQYVYRCPHVRCRNRIVEPEVLPAHAAIDWSVPGVRIGDRADLGMRPLEDATIARIRAGIARYWTPILAPAGGTWRTTATPLGAPMPARTTRETDGVAVPSLPSLMVPVEGRDGKQATPAAAPMRTQTARNETGLACLPPFQVSLRGGGCKDEARPVADPLGTVTASGNHHGVVTPLIMRNNTVRGDQGYLCSPVTEHLRTLTTSGHQSLLVPYYGNGTARSVGEPVGAFSTRDRWALADGTAGIDPADIDVTDVRFRMLEPHEIQAGMAFRPDYTILGTAKRDIVRQLGNAVTPPVAEVIVSALVEAITGSALEPAA